jgi:hypothetical protein
VLLQGQEKTDRRFSPVTDWIRSKSTTSRTCSSHCAVNHRDQKQSRAMNRSMSSSRIILSPQPRVSRLYNVHMFKIA